jgi:predicted transcriptional regulator
MVFDFIKTHPGAHLRQIRRDLDLSMGVVQYHLYSLERERKILSRRGGLYKRFYPALIFSEHQQEVLDVLSQETERDMLIYLLRTPDATQKEISDFAQISGGTANWHMKRMVSSGLVGVRREGQFVRYNVNGDRNEILKLVQSYHPSVWARWADRFANALSEVSETNKEANLIENKMQREEKKHV